jgi:hypothetical protein
MTRNTDFSNNTSTKRLIEGQTPVLRLNDRIFRIATCWDEIVYWLCHIGEKRRHNVTAYKNATGGNFPLENIAFEIKDNCTIIGYALLPWSRVTGCPLVLYPDLLLIWWTESKSDIMEIMDSLLCFLHNVNSTSRIQNATWKCAFTISV